jgi:Protein of unknown function (DUF3300)
VNLRPKGTSRKEMKGMKGDALAKALESQPWDPSVRSLVNFPDVLAMMNDKLEWTQKLGDALFLAQQKHVMRTEPTRLDIFPPPRQRQTSPPKLNKRVSNIEKRELEEIPVMGVEALYTMGAKQSRQMGIRNQTSSGGNL